MGECGAVGKMGGREGWKQPVSCIKKVCLKVEMKMNTAPPAPGRKAPPMVHHKKTAVRWEERKLRPPKAAESF